MAIVLSVIIGKGNMRDSKFDKSEISQPEFFVERFNERFAVNGISANFDGRSVIVRFPQPSGSMFSEIRMTEYRKKVDGFVEGWQARGEDKTLRGFLRVKLNNNISLIRDAIVAYTGQFDTPWLVYGRLITFSGGRHNSEDAKLVRLALEEWEVETGDWE